MKVKSISKILVTTLLLTNLNIPSFAGTLSEDGRYETFEDSEISIMDILEEDRVNVEVEGQTLVNSLNYNTNSDFSSLGGKLTDDGYIEIETDGSNYKNFFVKKEALVVKPSTEYTFFVEIAENTLTKISDTSAHAFIFGASNDSSQNSLWINNKSFPYNTKPGVYKFTLTTKDSFDNVVVGDRGFVNKNYSGKFKFRYMIIEGNHTDKDIPFFKGMKSVGEDTSSISITSESKEYKYNKIEWGKDRFNYHLKNVIKSGTKVTNKSDKVVVLLHYTKGTEAWVKDITLQPNQSCIIEDGLDVRIVTFYTFKDWTFNNIPKYLSDAIEIDNGYYDEVDIQLKEPLRGLPGGAKDKIIKKDGQWVIERNCKEFLIDTSKAKMYYEQIWNDYYGVAINVNENLGMKIGHISGINTYYSDFIVYPNYWSVNLGYHNNEQNMYGISSKHNEYIQFFLKIPKVNIDTYQGTDDEKVQQWFKDNCNELKIIYQLENPLYEPLKVDLSLQLFKDTTYILNSSNIPANMKVIADRVLNRAVEAIEASEANPTIGSLSQARYWTNLARESIKKDELQDKINNITEIKDLSIEKKTATANLDLYIKSKNSLTMSLSTNSITFKGYSGVEDLEMLNAVDIVVSSSLPYSLNAYLSVPISNADGSKVMSANTLNIRDNTESNYSQFVNTTDKVVLKDDCNAGNNNVHTIDLKLSSNNLHEADVYKTVVKFEAEQK